LTADGVAVAVRDDAWLAEQGFGGVLAVGGGSVSPPRLIQASWRPRGARAGAHAVLVGKGVTFDTGGINLKPGGAMTTMHTDMSGAAAALAAMRAVARAQLPVRVTVLAPLAENAFAGGSFRPGDIIRHVGGRTSEVTNTDAEGRLVLADALAYAVRTLRPTVLVDIATLTGAAKVALGLRTAGLFATSDRLAAGLCAAARAAGEPVWRLPLPTDYEPTLHSIIADADNAPGNPGAITAALFLRHFVGDVAWAHLDIAGPARSGKSGGLLSRGATGFGARLLARWLESLA
jgi:leucyl aminopeptidase